MNWVLGIEAILEKIRIWTELVPFWPQSGPNLHHFNPNMHQFLPQFEPNSAQKWFFSVSLRKSIFKIERITFFIPISNFGTFIGPLNVPNFTGAMISRQKKASFRDVWTNNVVISLFKQKK